MTYFIAGGGPAAVNAVQSIRKTDSNGRIIMVSPEGMPYSRITVPELMCGEIDESRIYIVDSRFFEANNVELLAGQRVAEVDVVKHAVTLDDGSMYHYDKLLLATGSHPYAPEWADMTVKGVFQLWNKSDALSMIPYVKQGVRAVIAGGGLVGMQAARALSSAGVDVTVIARRRLMTAQMDQHASDMLKDAAEAAGVKVLLGEYVDQILSANGSVTAVRLKDGTELAADIVLVSMGVRPNLNMITSADRDYSKGICVDEYLRTEFDDVYAAGDITIADDYLSGGKNQKAIWLNAVRQGCVAGLNMAGNSCSYDGLRTMNSIRLFGLNIATVGCTVAGEDMYEDIIVNEKKEYLKYVFKNDGTLMGVTAVGNISSVGILNHKIGTRCEKGFWGNVPKTYMS